MVLIASPGRLAKAHCDVRQQFMTNQSTASNIETGPRIGAALYIVTLLAHVAIGTQLYHWRIVSESSITDSDAVVFLLPALLATIGYFFALSFMKWTRDRFAPRIIISLIMALVSFGICMIVSLNKYGS